MRVVKNIINIKEFARKPKRLYMLGKMHWKKHIKPYFYSTFARTLFQSVYVLSKDDATEEMDAWINQIAFVMKYMIVPLVESK
jgi:hemoglobin-like flavoprotein